jgi:hypothetical protein
VFGPSRRTSSPRRFEEAPPSSPAADLQAILAISFLGIEKLRWADQSG